MKGVSDLILQATIRVKGVIDDPVVPLLDLAANEDPAYKEVAVCYKNIQENLGKAVQLLKAMK
jgi:hypothetical protein